MQYRSQNRKRFIDFCLLFSACFILLASCPSSAADKTALKDDIRQAIRKELMNSVSGEVEITGFRVLKGTEFLSGKGEYKIDKVAMNGYNGQNRINFLVNLSDGKSDTQKIIAEVSFDVLTDVFVATKLLSRGTLLSAADFYIVKQKVRDCLPVLFRTKRISKG